MPRKLFGMGAHGGIIGEIQSKLFETGFDPKGADGLFGKDTATAVKRFQQAQGLQPTGEVDDVTWQLLMKVPVPGIDRRSLELTAAFEGHGYSLAVGNFDGAWLTWGIIGFTMKHGEVQKIILEINRSNPHLIEDAFGENSNALLGVMQAPPARQEQWANMVTSNGHLVEPWRTGFGLLGQFPEVRAAQLRRAHDEYFIPALTTAKVYDLTSELGIALCFDIHVQDGGVKRAARDLIDSALEPLRDPAESEVRAIVANAVADVASPKYRDDVRERKLTIATGSGQVHGSNYLLENWGLMGFAAETVEDQEALAVGF